MIQWVYERASEVLPDLVVATDDHRISKSVEAFGGQVIMTSGRHRTGTERCAEAAGKYRQLRDERITHVVNIQGDEPLLRGEQLQALQSCFQDPQVEIATLIRPLQSMESLTNPNEVKVTVDKALRALYFSRSPIPHVREPGSGKLMEDHTFYGHIGLYAYRADVLNELVNLPESPLERAESLEQLRWLEHGYSIVAGITTHKTRGVDTPEDLEAVRKLI